MITKQVKIADIKNSGVIRTPILPKGFIERIVKFKKTLADVEKISLEETVLNFQKDVHPEIELEIWEHIAKSYQDFVCSNLKLTPEEKKETLGILLARSAGEENFDNTKKLSKEQVNSLKKAFI